ncbi:serine/threonine-protein kinase [Acanthopleuribacter pedis]|uniref:Serine/threonine protein kinase n=1 Tax=Acanthopleuribacter pedis TaxID=442870 RepID=A0A8J7QKJ5_9BACT|nr:serine/threonine-protein kinase [Acanthopleuribacter pedis]MBO1322721.1 serine/threonine protein kinase [Acanthopleuribacter pedis]
MADLWQKLEQAFEHCYTLSKQDRAQYLKALEQEDPDLFLELQKLLDADDLAAGDSFFDPSSLHAAQLVDEEMVGQQIGTFTLTRLIGEGGMGAVYLAEQEKPFKRRVAIKIIRVHTTNERLQRRFEIEVQTLARLNHPNIASVHFAGTTESGLPYFAMEYVEGLPLDDYCRNHALDINARLNLFAAICRAVHFAHQRGIIHRDLKPANILITEIDGQPQPKIIDFGIAKAVQNDGQLEHSFQVTATQLTIPGMAVGTLGYMSPEQTLVTDRDIDLRTDVYSLGVILYEMLVGNLPLSRETMNELTWDQIFRAIREDTPVSPSRAVLGKNATLSGEINLDAQKLARRYRGEIDWITMKAMEKEPHRRYESARDLAEDCERHLEGLPVQAGPPSMGYQISRFVRRNRLLTTAVTLIFAALLLAVAGFATAYFQAKEAEEKIQKEVETAQTTIEVLEEFITSVSPRNQGTEVKLLDQLYAFSPKIDTMPVSDPIRGNLHHLVGKAYRTLSQFETANQHLKKAVSLREKSMNADAFGLLESRYEYCVNQEDLQGYDNTAPCFIEILESDQPNLKNSHILASSSLNAAMSFLQIRNYESARAHIQKAEAIIKDFPPSTLFVKLKTYNTWGRYYYRLENYDQAVEVLKEGIALNDHHSNNQALLILAYQHLADAYSLQRKHDIAFETFKKSLEAAEIYYGVNHPHYAEIEFFSAYLYLRSGRSPEVLNTVTRLYLALHFNRNHRNEDLYHLMDIGFIASRVTGRNKEYLNLYQNYFSQNYNDHEITMFEVKQLNLLAATLLRADELEQALAVAHTAFSYAEALDHPAKDVSSDIANNLCRIYGKLEKYQQAEPWGCIAVTFAEAAFGRSNETTLRRMFVWVAVLVRGKHPTGPSSLEQYIREAEEFWGPDSANAKAIRKFRDNLPTHLLK